MSFTNILLKLKNKSLFHKNLDQNNKAIIIIEPRKHVLLKPVIINTLDCLEKPSEWNVYIFTNHENLEWVKSEFIESEISIKTIGLHNFTQITYSMFMMTLNFWENFKEEHILITQTDVIMFRKGIDKFIERDYDYYGANYYDPDNITKNNGGIQGGFSLRKRSVMIECIKNITWKEIENYRGKPIKNHFEDIFFSYACEMLKKKLLPIEERHLFSIEADYYPFTLGHHGTTKNYFSKEQINEIICQSSYLKALCGNS